MVPTPQRAFIVPLIFTLAGRKRTMGTPQLKWEEGWKRGQFGHQPVSPDSVHTGTLNTYAHIHILLFPPMTGLPAGHMLLLFCSYWKLLGPPPWRVPRETGSQLAADHKHLPEATMDRRLSWSACKLRCPPSCTCSSCNLTSQDAGVWVGETQAHPCPRTRRPSWRGMSVGHITYCRNGIQGIDIKRSRE